MFLSHPLAGKSLGTTYDVRIGLIGKRVLDFLLVLIELISTGVTPFKVTQGHSKSSRSVATERPYATSY